MVITLVAITDIYRFLNSDLPKIYIFITEKNIFIDDHSSRL